MTIFYLILTAILILLIVVGIIRGTKFNKNESIFILKASRINKVYIYIASITLLFFVVAILLMFLKQSEISLEKISMLSFWTIMLVVLSNNYPREYYITNDGILSTIFASRIGRSYSWKEIQGVMISTNGKLKFNIVVKRMNITLSCLVDSENYELLNYLNEKCELTRI